MIPWIVGAGRCYHLLLARGADPTILDGEGRTAAQLGPADVLYDAVV